MKTVIVRLFDLALIACLIVGSHDAKTFAFWIVSMMVILLWVGVFAIDATAATKIKGRSVVKKTIRLTINAAYTGALIYAGFPVLAALYVISIIALRAICEKKIEEAKGVAA